MQDVLEVGGAGSGLNRYPGRGLLVGSLTTSKPFLCYFVTGRSATSLARWARIGAGGEVVIEPTSGVADDDLRHYVAIKEGTDSWFVGNGAHVEALSAFAFDELGRQFRSWSHEPDPPIWTPRIVAAVAPTHPPRVIVSTARRVLGGGTEHLSLDVGAVPDGHGVRVVTYQGSVENPRPDGQPHWVQTASDIEELVAEIWQALPVEHRVVVFARDLEAGKAVDAQRHDPDASR